MNKLTLNIISIIAFTGATLLSLELLINKKASAISFWNFNETGGSTAIDSIGSNNGTYLNGLTPSGGIASFDGVDDFIQIGDSDDLDFGISDFFVSARLSTNYSSDTGVIFDKRRVASGAFTGYSLYLAKGQVAFQLAGGGSGTNFTNFVTTNPGAFVADGSFHTIDVIVDRDSNTGVQVFVDNTLVESFDGSSFQSISIDNDFGPTIGRRSDFPLAPAYFVATYDYVGVGLGTDTSVLSNSQDIPESSNILGLMAVGALGITTFKRKLKSSKLIEKKNTELE